MPTEGKNFLQSTLAAASRFTGSDFAGFAVSVWAASTLATAIEEFSFMAAVLAGAVSGAGSAILAVLTLLTLGSLSTMRLLVARSFLTAV